MLLNFLRARREALENHPSDARKIAGPEATDNIAECAAWTLTARAVMNLDELVTRE